MVSRLLLTMSVATSLVGLYGIYAVVTRPMMVLPTLSVTAPIELETPPPRPVENVRIAQQYLPQQTWAMNARYHMKTQDQAYLFANEWKPELAEKRVRLRPFAMVWISRDAKTGEEKAVTMVSESAVVKFAGTLELPRPEPGRMVHAVLDGRAQVHGPDGLVIDGRNLTFSEAARQLWSDYEVRYEYAGNRGRADKLQIDLIPQEGLPGKDRPHIFGIRNIRLSRNVQMAMQMKDKDGDMPLTVKCNGSFDYDTLQQKAMFTDDVVAYRQLSPTSVDWIECDRLQVQMASPDDGRTVRALPEPGKSEEFQRLHPRLSFVSLQADSEGNPESGKGVRLLSSAQQMEVRAAELFYDGAQRQIHLEHPTAVKVFRARQPVLQVPQIVLTLNEGNTLRSALCRGAGWVVHRDDTQQKVLFSADWKQQLQYMAGAEAGTGAEFDTIELNDTASFRQPTEESALGAEVIRVWLKQAKKDSSTPSTEKPNSLDPAAGLSKVEVQRMEAERDVVLVTPKLEAHTEKLELWIDPTLKAVDPIAQPKESPATPGQPAAGKSANAGSLPISARAAVVRVRLRPGRETSPDLADLWAEGRVAMQQTRGPGQAPMSIRANEAHLENHGGMRQVLHLLGQPVQVEDRAEGLSLEGRSMHLDRADNQFRVDGGGVLQFPVKSGMDGAKLAKAETLRLEWTERMAFDGLLATFRGGAQASLGSRRLRCESMEVTLNERLRFDQPPTRDRKLELQSMTCRDNVELWSYEYQLNKLMAIQYAKVWELHVNQASGDTHAQGPGVMQMWRRDQAPRTTLLPQQVSAANTPIQVEAANWEFTGVKFDGQMVGQMQHRHAVFKERVEILHGPVKLPKQVLVRDQLDKSGRFMSCDELQITQIPDAASGKYKLEIAGEGNVWCEGHEFAASADQVVYDERQQSYLLRCKGRNNARIWRNVMPGVNSVPTTFQRGKFFPLTRQLQIDSASEISQ